MDVRWTTAFLDSPTADVEPFWLAVTGTTLSPERALVPGRGDPYLRVQVTGGPARTHLDLHVAGVPEAAAQAVARGAQVVRDAGDLVVLRSPAGLEFCLVGWRGEGARPAPVRWPGGQSSLLDQVCLDLPEPQFEAEAAFWSELTGWERSAVGLPEFEALRRPDGMPLRLLLQRIGSPVAGMHVDFACDDAPAEVRRHVELGAQVVRVVPDDWTTLRDPAGREYCVTRRGFAGGSGGGFVGGT